MATKLALQEMLRKILLVQNNNNNNKNKTNDSERQEAQEQQQKIDKRKSNHKIKCEILFKYLKHGRERSK